MSHTQDMVMVTSAISLEIFEGEIGVFVPQTNLKVLNSTCVKVTADTNRSQDLPSGKASGTTKKAQMVIFKLRWLP